MLIVVIWLYLGSETLHVLISVVSYLMLQQNLEWFDILIPAYPCYPENWLLNGCIGNVVDIRICLHLFFGVFTLPLTMRLCFPLSVCMSLSNMSQMLIADISAICELCIWELSALYREQCVNSCELFYRILRWCHNRKAYFCLL